MDSPFDRLGFMEGKQLPIPAVGDKHSMPEVHLEYPHLIVKEFKAALKSKRARN